MASARDDFPAKIKRAIAERACYVCSNPNHRVFTMQAHSDPVKSLGSGVAAHICGAASNGPRYDPTQSPAQRRHPSNGIWLCHSCSDIVDKDEAKYTVEVLTEWRADHELWVANQGMVATLPEISISTLDGLTLPPSGGRVTADEIAFFRQHHLIIKNRGHYRLDGLSARVQLPERAKLGGIEGPAGIPVELKPERMKFVAMVTGGGSVDFPKVDHLPIDIFKLSIGHILPGMEVTFTLYSGPNEPGAIGELSSNDLDANNRGSSLHYFIAGEFLYQRNEAYLRREFLVPIAFDFTTRKLSSWPCEEDVGARGRWEHQTSW